MNWNEISSSLTSLPFFWIGLKIFGIVFVTGLVLQFGQTFIEKVIRKAITANGFLSAKAEKKREDTLIRVFWTAMSIVTVITAGLMILETVGISTGPLLASLGIVGIAVGFGGQYLIKDVITGFFIILENQYRVGDVVCLGDKCGLVEDINLRTTVMRDLDGTVHHVPNGEIQIASNLSKFHSNVNINVGVAYDTDLDQLIEVINRVGNDLANDEQWQEDIHKAPQFLRVDDFGDSAIIVKILGETEPLRQWDVAGEFRKRLKKAFDQERIVMPFPQRDLHVIAESALPKELGVKSSQKPVVEKKAHRKD